MRPGGSRIRKWPPVPAGSITAASHSYTLRGQVARLELTTRMTLVILATASGIFTYSGVRELLDGDATTVFLGVVIYSVSVSVGIYAFWSYLMRIMPHVRRPAGRRMLYLAMAIGAAMIMAMSAWLNAAALAGAGAREQHMSVTTDEYQGELNEAHENALAAQSLLPDIELSSQRFARLADEERSSGALTGTSGSGTVVQLFSQMSSQLAGLQTEIEASRDDVSALFKKGGERLGEMRRLVAADGSVKGRDTRYAAQATELAGIIGSLQQTSVAPSVKRATEDLGRTFIAPAANGSDAGLQDRQTAVVGQVETAVRQQGLALAATADAILDRPRDVDRSISQIQATIAECQTLLVDIGIDPRLWIHAMQMPPDELYVLTPDELSEFRLTGSSDTSSAPGVG